MDQQEDITHFQEQFNGPFPFNANGIVVALPSASFEEEMQTKIVFVGGTIGNNARDVRAREHAPVVGRQRLLRRAPQHVLQGGPRDDRRSTTTPRDIAGKAAGGQWHRRLQRGVRGQHRDPLQRTELQHDVARRSGTSRRRTRRRRTCSAPRTPTRARARPTSRCARSSARPTTTRVLQADPARLRRRLDLAASSEIAISSKYMPNKSIGCSNKLDAFFKQWWDTAYTGSPAAGNKPRSRARAWPAAASMTPTAAARTTAPTSPATAGGTVPATLSLTLGTPATFGAVHAGRGEDVHGLDDRERHLDRGRRGADVADPSATARATWSTARSRCRRR